VRRLATTSTSGIRDRQVVTRRPELAALVLLATLLVAGAAAAAAPEVARSWEHRRDAAAYHSYVTTYVGGWWSSRDPHGSERDEAWVADHPDEVMAAGDRACAWLDDQPSASDVDAAGEHTVAALTRRYLASDGAAEPGLSAMGNQTLVAGAWSYLCWSTREDRTAPTFVGED
jgi:hypothetical protein